MGFRISMLTALCGPVREPLGWVEMGRPLNVESAIPWIGVLDWREREREGEQAREKELGASIHFSQLPYSRSNETSHLKLLLPSPS